MGIGVRVHETSSCDRPEHCSLGVVAGQPARLYARLYRSQSGEVLRSPRIFNPLVNKGKLDSGGRPCSRCRRLGVKGSQVRILPGAPCDVSGHRRQPDLRIAVRLFVISGCGLVLWVCRWVGSRGWGRGEFAEEFAGGGVDDADVEVLDEQDDVGSGVGSPDSDVVEPAVHAQGHVAGLVDLVVADPVVAVGAPVGGRGGLWAACRRRWPGCPLRKRPVWPLAVVVVDEGVEQGLQLGHGGRLDRLGRAATSSGSAGIVPPCRRWWGGSGGSSSGRCPGAGVRSRAVAAAAAAGEPGGVHHAVVGQRGGRDPVQVSGLPEGGQHDRAGDPPVGGDVQGVAGVVVEPADDLYVGAGSPSGG